MRELVNEKISVVTIFRKDSVKNEVIPYQIKWQARKYKISKVTYHHTLKEGKKLWHIFYVTDGNLDFKLKLDTDTLHWFLEEVTDGLTN